MTAAAWSALLAAAAVQLWYAHAGPASPTFDDAWYLEMSLRLYDSAHRGLMPFLSTYAGLFQIKAPLLSVLALPCYLVFGRSLASALLVNTAMLLFLGFYTHGLARRFYGRDAGILALLIVSTMPLLYGLSRLFLVECALSAAVAAWMYHLAASEGFTRKPQNIALGLWLGAGLLLKVLYPLYIAGPTAAVILHRLRRARPVDRARAQAAAKTILGLGLGLALTWYAFNWMYVLGYALKAGYGDIAANYGSHSVFSPSVLWAYACAISTHAFSGYYVLAGAALAAFGFLSGVRWREPLREERSRLLLAWVLLPLVVLAFGVNKDVRFIAPLLPGAAIALAGALDRLPLGRWRLPALAAFFLFPLDLFAHQSFGRSFLVHGGARAYNGPPQAPNPWRPAELVDAIAALRGGRKELMVIVALEHPAFNANNLAYYSALKGYPVYFASLGYAQDSVQKAVIRIREKGATHLITVSGIPPEQLPPVFNQVNGGIQELLDSRRLPFRVVRSLALGPGIRATVYERI